MSELTAFNLYLFLLITKDKCNLYEAFDLVDGFEHVLEARMRPVLPPTREPVVEYKHDDKQSDLRTFFHKLNTD